jgi:long-chain acyl-CoA synthetase
MTLRTGIVSGERQMSLAALQTNVLKAASGFAHLGIGPRDCVALLLRNDMPVLEAAFAANRLGAYAVPINWHFKGPEVAYIVADCQAKVLVAHADLLAAVAPSLPPHLRVIVVTTPPEVVVAYSIDPRAAQPTAGAIVWSDWIEAQVPHAGTPVPSGGSILYTSGTTGRPKGVRRIPPKPDEVATQVRVANELYQFKPGLRLIIPGPLYHSAPYSYATRFSLGSEVTVLMPRFDPVGMLELIERERLEHMFVVPTMFVRLLKLPDEVRKRFDVSSLKFVMHAAAPCPPEVKRAMIDWWGPVIWEFYGGTETGALTISNSAEWRARPGTVGRPVKDAKVKIFGEDGQEVPQGEIGEVYGRILGTADFTYHGKDEERAKVDREGLITCGDVGYFDAEGYLHLCDRKRDMVISGGVNIYPAEIESVLVNMPDVADGCVFGIPDDEFGEKLMAVVQPMPGKTLDPQAIRAYLAEHLANYKVPSRIEIQSDLPREDSGKIFKRRLREPFWEGREKRI